MAEPEPRPAHWEIVTSARPQPYRARLVGANSEVVLWSESYADRRDAERAIALADQASWFTDMPDVPDAPVCPECAAAKHVNCAGTALDETTDEIVPCACAESGHTS